MSGKGISAKLLGYLFYVLIVLGAVGFGFGCFLGMDFYTLGDKTQSITVAAVAAGVLLALAVALAHLKRTYGNFKVCFIAEMILLIVFFGAAGYFAYSDLSHYFVVTKQRNKIQNKLDECITNTEKMFTEYDGYVKKRKDFYERYLAGLADSNAKKTRWSEYTGVYYDTTGRVSDLTQREELLFKLTTELCPSNYDKMKQVSSSWLGEARGVVKNWSPIDIVKPIGIVDVVNNVEQNSKAWRDTLVSLSKYRQKKEDAENFAGRLSFDNTLSDVKGRFRERGDIMARLNVMAVATTLVLVALMLVYWLWPGRSSKFKVLDWILGRHTDGGKTGKAAAVEDDTTIPRWF
ncbi:MAG: hypothetical protein LBB74_03965 [Chitinispirillales bacterium]|nr:hypothetical protein [Chitinispirillales bacterium]